jgi:hypothetical protein
MQANMLQEGQEILEGRFKIIKKLGSGAFGEIFKGKSLNTPNSRAICPLVRPAIFRRLRLL